MLKFNVHKFLIVIIICFASNPIFALTVSPAKLEVSGDPGQIVRGEVEIFNEQDSEKTFFVSYENFESRGDSGAPYFTGAEEGLATWIDTEDKFVLKSGERLTVPYSITIPDGAESGGYFGAIFFGSQPFKGEKGGEVSVGGKIGILVFLRVSGEVAEGGGLLDFTTKDKQRFFTTLPIFFEYRLNNTGGDRIVPSGEINIKNIFGFTSVKLLTNENKGSVLPSSTKKFSVVWEKESSVLKTNNEIKKGGFFGLVYKQITDFHLGWYTAKLNVSWGESNTSNDSYDFFIIPWQLLLIVLIVFVFFGSLAFVGIRKYNRFIISRATSQK